MSAHERVPNELWIEVFRCLSRASLQNVSLTHHKFRNLSRRLLFAHLDFHPYYIGPNNSFLVPNVEIERSSERLDFWFSDEIAPFVRSCSISPWKHLRPDWGLWIFSVTDTPHIILDPFFENLWKFTGLRTLHSRVVGFTQTGVANLCRLPSLADVRLDQWDGVDEQPIDTTSLELYVSRFAFRRRGDSEAEDGGDIWVPLLRPERLRELEMVWIPNRLAETLDRIPPFPHVYKLTTGMYLSTMSQNFSILSHFPGVEIFSMRGWGEVQDGPGPRLQASTVLPRLKEYTGPCQTVSIFLTKSTLTRITIEYCKPQDFIAQLQGLRAPENLTLLDVTFDDLEIPEFDTICAFFTRITELRIKVVYYVEEGAFGDPPEEGDNYMATMFFKGLADASALPPALERLAIRWEFMYEDLENAPPVDPEDIPSFDELHNVLLGHCPALTTLWLDGHDFLFRWRKAPDGADSELQEQAATCDVDEAAVLRKELPAFWGTR
ncbi:hypothetical protein B0H11DRAFT_2272646 [Mycena galericulata]|nr:hypothetical protein B0H11DRAFT_2272646 [Mycena galericulata]